MKLLALAGLLLAAAVVAAACRDASSAPEPAGTASPAASTPKPGRSATVDPSVLGPAGSDGLTVRYRDPEGGLKKLRVEDFPR